MRRHPHYNRGEWKTPTFFLVIEESWMQSQEKDFREERIERDRSNQTVASRTQDRHQPRMNLAFSHSTLVGKRVLWEQKKNTTFHIRSEPNYEFVFFKIHGNNL